MSSPINYSLIVGKVDGPCELRTSKAGKPYAQFKLLSVRQVAGKDEDCVLNCVAYGGIAEKVATAARIGAPILCAGRLRTERWEYQGKPYSKLVLALDDARVVSDDTPVSAPPESAPVPATADQPPF